MYLYIADLLTPKSSNIWGVATSKVPSSKIAIATHLRNEIQSLPESDTLQLKGTLSRDGRVNHNIETLCLAKNLVDLGIFHLIKTQIQVLSPAPLSASRMNITPLTNNILLRVVIVLPP